MKWGKGTNGPKLFFVRPFLFFDDIGRPFNAGMFQQWLYDQSLVPGPFNSTHAFAVEQEQPALLASLRTMWVEFFNSLSRAALHNGRELHERVLHIKSVMADLFSN
jgi:hypothetical protein